ncbi:MAG: glycosyltransferase family 2 protein, partial [Planctomycetota bacterium]
GELRWEGVPPEQLLARANQGEVRAAPIPSLFPLGGAVALDRARFLELGGFDPLYHPFYYEDVDLGLCAWRRGWKCLVEPRSRVRHDEGGTIGKHFKRFKVKVAKRRHRILMTWKHADSRWLRAHLAWLPLKVLTKALKLDVRFEIALFQALVRLPHALRARAREKLATKVTLEAAFEEIRSFSA